MTEPNPGVNMDAYQLSPRVRLSAEIVARNVLAGHVQGAQDIGGNAPAGMRIVLAIDYKDEGTFVAPLVVDEGEFIVFQV